MPVGPPWNCEPGKLAKHADRKREGALIAFHRNTGGHDVKLIRNFFKDESGASAVEYGLLVALIAVVIIGAVTMLGQVAQRHVHRVLPARLVGISILLVVELWFQGLSA